VYRRPTYLSMIESADKDYVLGYWMRGNGTIPKDTDMKKLLDYYYQICSIEGDCSFVSLLGATLANDGICPLTGQRAFDSKVNKKANSLLLNCGMNEGSIQWLESIGLPGKSGISGATMIVIPKVMGICVYSPIVDIKGNSIRAFEFSKLLVQRFSSLKSNRI